MLTLSLEAPLRPDCTASVILPARDEAVHLVPALQALASQIDLRGRPVPWSSYEVIVLANNCTDDTAEIARWFARRHPEFVLHVVERHIPADQACAGYARRLLMDEAHWRLQHKPQALIASTDADSVVAPDWLAQMRHEFAQGADAVGGRILLHEEDRGQLPARALRGYLLDLGYFFYRSALANRLDPEAHDPCPRHHQFFGASMAVTVSAYRLCGGLPPRESLEDLGLHEALYLADARVRHSLKVRVSTSARRSGRTERGLSTQLQVWEERTDRLVVESIAMIEHLLRWQRRLRELWTLSAGSYSLPEHALRSLADELQTSPGELQYRIQQARSFGHLIEASRLWVHWRAHHPNEPDRQPVTQALADLRARLGRSSDRSNEQFTLAPLPLHRSQILQRAKRLIRSASGNRVVGHLSGSLRRSRVPARLRMTEQ